MTLLHKILKMNEQRYLINFNKNATYLLTFEQNCVKSLTLDKVKNTSTIHLVNYLLRLGALPFFKKNVGVVYNEVNTKIFDVNKTRYKSV